VERSTVVEEVKEAVLGRLAALDEKDVDKGLNFFTQDGVVDAGQLENISGIYHGQEELRQFYSSLFASLPEVKRTANNINMNISEGEVLVIYDILVDMITGSGMQRIGTVGVTDFWRREVGKWKLAKHIGRINR
jgi:ketosteroid isomerase-like protein